MKTFRTEKVTDHITRIYAFATELMYLVEGTERAVLIDTGSGFGSLKNCVEQLTDKKITVLMTHGHVDHAMGAGEFEDLYLSIRDREVYNCHSTKDFRCRGLAGMSHNSDISEQDMIPSVPFEKFQNIQEGDLFDLGGIHIEIYDLPGHTEGSVVMLIPEERYLLLGDACNPFLFLFDEFSTGLSTYEKNLRELQPKIAGKYEHVLMSHADGVGPLTIVEDVLKACEDIKAGNYEEGTFPFMGEEHYFADNGTGTKICYNRNRIWE